MENRNKNQRATSSEFFLKAKGDRASNTPFQGYSFGSKNANFSENEKEGKNPDKPLPHLKGLGKRLKSKNGNILKESDINPYKKRVLSRKSREDNTLDCFQSMNAENFTETKHLISNRSPNYIELNKVVMNKLKLKGNKKVEKDYHIFENAGINTSSIKYKFGMKGVLVRSLIYLTNVAEIFIF